MARYLDDSWFDDARTAITALPGVDTTTTIVVEVTTTDAPDGDRTYHVIVAPDGSALRDGPADAPTVTLRQTYDVATAIAKGELSAQSAFMQGDLQVGGNLAALVDTYRPLALLPDVLGALRARVDA